MKISSCILFISFLLFSCTAKKSNQANELNIVVSAKVKGLDPIFADDLYSGTEVARIYEGLLQYHYLKRPYELIPNLAESMPEVSADGLTYTFKIKKGVVFQDNECFPGGKGRELKASDFVYSIRRLADPKTQSGGWWLIDGKIKGLNEWRDKYANAATVNYDEEIAGVKATDDYTLVFTLTKPFPQFLYALAMPFTFATPKEAVEKYGQEFINNPVGTGAFKLIGGKYTQSNKIEYEKNPTYREEFYPSEGTSEDIASGLLADAGKKLPLVDKLVVHIITEDNPRWLGFLKGNFESIGVPKDNFNQAIDANGELTPEMKSKGIREEKIVGLDVTYVAFNHSDKLFKTNKKLRQAIGAAYNHAETNKLFFNGLAVPAQSILPPDLAGYDVNYKNPAFAGGLEGAKKLLAEAGYPGGKGLPEIPYYLTASTTSRQMAEFLKDSLAKIGVNIKPEYVTWPELQNKVNKREATLYGMAWSADYPDAENFFAILYGPNQSPGSNGSNYDDPKFNEMFKVASTMQNSPERTKKYEEMYRYIGEEMPLVFGFHRVNYALNQGWLRNNKYHEFNHGMSKYLGIDLEKKEQLQKKL
jgi:oligopeptide transport system substrate-binding protein